MKKLCVITSLALPMLLISSAYSAELSDLEILNNSTLKVGIEYCNEQLQQGNYNESLKIDATINSALDSINKNSKLHVPSKLLADSYLCKGLALFNLSMSDKTKADGAVASFKESIKYLNSPQANFALGATYALSKEDYELANKYTKYAATLDNAYQQKYQDIFKRFIEPGLKQNRKANPNIR